jgi:hypothetical protein
MKSRTEDSDWKRKASSEGFWRETWLPKTGVIKVQKAREEGVETVGPEMNKESNTNSEQGMRAAKNKRQATGRDSSHDFPVVVGNVSSKGDDTSGEAEANDAAKSDQFRAKAIENTHRLELGFWAKSE